MARGPVTPEASSKEHNSTPSSVDMRARRVLERPEDVGREDRAEARGDIGQMGGKRDREDDSCMYYKVGQQIDVLDSVDRWSEARVLRIDHDNNRIYVTFLYWSHHFDAWVDDVANRCAHLHTHTYVPGGILRVGQRLDVLDEVSKWLEAFVIEEKPYEVLIHFKGFSKKFDVWLSRDSPRIRQFGYGDNNRNRAIIPQKTWAVPGNPKSAAVDRTRKIAITSDTYVRYADALKANGLNVFPVAGDGNCLFRSVAHQLYGDDSLHKLIRDKCMDYMEVNAQYFAMFVEGGVENFHLYIAMKRELACWGDDPEIQALCEIYGRRAEIWAFDPVKGAKMLRTYHEQSVEHRGSGSSSAHSSATICLSFYGGGHYDSIVGPRFDGFLLTSLPGTIEDEAISRAQNLLSSDRRSQARSGSVPRDDVAIAVSISDAEASENAELELALASSRREMEAFGEEDIETCLALSLSSFNHESKGGSLAVARGGQQLDVRSPSVAESKSGVEATAAGSADKAGDLELDDKAVLEFILKQSADEHSSFKSDFAVSDPAGQSEEELIEAQILEQARQESLLQQNITSDHSDPKSSDSDRAATSAASSSAGEKNIYTDEDILLAIRQSEEEMLVQALRLSASSSSIGNSWGGRSVPPAQIVVENTSNPTSEEEMIRMAILQSMQAVESSSNGRQFAIAGAGQTRNTADDDDDDEDMRRAIAASMQEK